MDTDIRKLKQRRAQIKGQVTHILHFFEAGSVTGMEAQVRLQKLEDFFRSFEEVQGTIEDKINSAEEEEFSEACDPERGIFEQIYYKAAAIAQELVSQGQAQSGTRIQAAEDDREIRERTSEITRRRPKLPEIKLPDFDGDYTKWLFFKDSFETTIHMDNSLTPVQKHQYLIGVLQGEARNVIQGFKISNENYESAWKLLKDTYDNNMLIIQNHLDELLKFTEITKHNKADSIRKFIWHIQTHVSALRSLALPVNEWDAILVHLAKKKLNFREQRDWQNLIKNRTLENMPMLSEFIAFLTERCHTIKVLEQGRPKIAEKSDREAKRNEQKVALVSVTSKCKICEGDHPVYKCSNLLKLSIADRKMKIIEKRLCLNCLGSGHYARDCKASMCKKCNKKHNSIIHEDAPEERGSSPSKQPCEDSRTTVVMSCTETQRNPSVGFQMSNKQSVSDTKNYNLATSVYCTSHRGTRVVLSTARIFVLDSNNEERCYRALLDPGSQSNLITSDLVRELKLACCNEIHPISGINKVVTRVNKIARIRIKSIHSNFETEVECLVVPTITEQLPQTKISAAKLHIPWDVKLADPTYNKPGPIDVLLGAGVYWKIITGAPENQVKGKPALQNTQLGVIIGGELEENQTEALSHCGVVTNAQLHNQLQRFWVQEEVPESLLYSKEEIYSEKLFSDTVRRQNGRFVVRLPIRAHVVMGDSMPQAVRRLSFLERRFEKDLKLKEAYSEFLKEYLQQGHMEVVEDQNAILAQEHYIIPHQPVVRPDSMTTKLRVVFDASSKTTNGVSLNLQADLQKILIRFRIHKFVLTANVASMFRQVLVDPEDRNLQLIVWRDDTTQPLQLYKLNTITYGTTCAPFLAMRCLKELAKIHKQEFPLAAKVVEQDFYMDDVLTGESTLRNIMTL